MVYVHDVCEFVHKRLDDLDDAGQLHWRNATIPPDEVWVKIGGDHGGGSFKVKFLREISSKKNQAKNVQKQWEPDPFHVLYSIVDKPLIRINEGLMVIN